MDDYEDEDENSWEDFDEELSNFPADNFFTKPGSDEFINMINSYLFDANKSNLWSWFASIPSENWTVVNLNDLNFNPWGSPLISKYFFAGANEKEIVWKTKYFVKQSLDISYRNHIRSHAAHIARQPSYYKGMFDIMN